MNVYSIHVTLEVVSKKSFDLWLMRREFIFVTFIKFQGDSRVNLYLISHCVLRSVGGKAPGRDATMRLDSVPTPFQNRGLTVTPSLFSSQAQCYGTGPDRTAQGMVMCIITQY